MKGISTVIATILMLLITIALAGTAYLYINGIFSSRTSVVLSLDGQSTFCAGTVSGVPGNITVYVKNDGTTVAGTVNVDMTYPNGTIQPIACVIPSIYAGTSNYTVCMRSGPGATGGLYYFRAVGGGSVATGTTYCAS